MRSLKRAEPPPAVHALVCYLTDLGLRSVLSDDTTCPGCSCGSVASRPGTSGSDTHDHGPVCYACSLELHATGRMRRLRRCLLRPLSAAQEPHDLWRLERHSERRDCGGDDETKDGRDVLVLREGGDPDPRDDAQRGLLPLNPEAAAPKHRATKKVRVDPSAVPFEVGS